MARRPEPQADEVPDMIVGEFFEDEEPTPVLAVGTHDDMTERALAAKRAASVQDDVASLAHDLKNPLTIIMLESSQVEQRLGSGTTPAVQRSLERISQNAAYIDRLISDMLDLSQHEAGKLELRIDRIDLSRLLRDAVGRAVPTQERNRVRLETRDFLFAYGDETRIERVISNLVHNALKYGGTHGYVTVRLDARGRYACISVIDTGPGLTAEESRRLFDRYKRGSTWQEGHGLGLYTSRKIVEAHKGRIGVVSQPGRGSRFYFELPAVPPSPNES